MVSIIGSSSKKSKSKPPIFVLGCQRSGTSLLRRILDSHPNIACPPESAFFVQLARVYEIERARAGLETMGFTKEDVLEQMRIFTVHFFEQYAKAKGKKRWADKTCPYVDHADTIDSMFKKDIAYIGIIRHGLDVAYSLCDFDFGALKPYLVDGTEKPVAAIRFWREQNIKLLNFKDKVKDRMHFIKYEDLSTKPESTLPPIFEFLDETWDEKILNFNEFEHDPGFDDPKIDNYDKIEPNSGNYKKWPLKLQKRVYKEAHTLLERLGYTL